MHNTVADFDFDLPKHLIALHPAPQRTHSRLLYLATDGSLIDSRFNKLVNILKKGDLLIVNDSKVIRARLYAKKPSGGKVEIMLERIMDEHNALVRLRMRKKPKEHTPLIIGNGHRLRIVERRGEFFVVEYLQGDIIDLFNKHGLLALPPYIKREINSDDDERYQTVYAQHPGSVAAPTAGLHFDADLLAHIHRAGIKIAFVTLHIGSGTYQPVRSDDLRNHKMHREFFQTKQPLCDAIRECRKRNGRVIAIGTTTVRVLESLAASGGIRPTESYTDIFIYPGFQFQVVDAMITNFHLPRTTLLMLVCAFAGKERILAAYRHAVKESYRFFSYGDAMLIEKNDAICSEA